MGKEMRELHEVHKLATEIIRTGQVSWSEAIEIAKEKVRRNDLDINNGKIYSIKTGETIGEI